MPARRYRSPDDPLTYLRRARTIACGSAEEAAAHRLRLDHLRASLPPPAGMDALSAVEARIDRGRAYGRAIAALGPLAPVLTGFIIDDDRELCRLAPGQRIAILARRHGMGTGRHARAAVLALARLALGHLAAHYQQENRN